MRQLCLGNARQLAPSQSQGTGTFLMTAISIRVSAWPRIVRGVWFAHHRACQLGYGLDSRS